MQILVFNLNISANRYIKRDEMKRIFINKFVFYFWRPLALFCWKFVADSVLHTTQHINGYNSAKGFRQLKLNTVIS